ncbi:MAG: ribose 5-phosphate isomerase A [Nitrososphaerota archaeon]
MSRQDSGTLALGALARELLERHRPRTIGLGSGGAAEAFLRGLAPLLRQGRGAALVASSLQIALVAEQEGLSALEHSPPEVDLVVDGADQVSASGALLKGRGGALLRERVLHAAARRLVILVEPVKLVAQLNAPVTLEVAPFARLLVLAELRRLGAKPSLRLLEKGYPRLTENGNLLVEADFGLIQDPAGLYERLRQLAGVVEVGIFLRPPDELYALEPGELCRRVNLG